MIYSVKTELYDFWSSKIRQLNFTFSSDNQIIRFNLTRIPEMEYFVSLHDPQYFFNTYLTQSIPRALFHITNGRNFVGWI